MGKVAGAVGVGLALLCNPWVLAAALSSDGVLASRTKVLIFCFETLLVAVGLLCAWQPKGLLRWGRRRPNTAAALFGIVLSLGLIVGIEYLFQWMAARRASEDRVAVVYPEGFHEYDPLLGYRPPANGRITAALVVRGKETRRATAVFDACRRRITPDPHPEREKKHFLLLFGGSMAYGSLVEDEGTVAYALASRLPESRIYNYAYGGYGPQQMLALLEQPDFPEEIAEAEGVAVYAAIPAHVQRAAGSMRTIAAWTHHFPYYAPGPNGEVERRGTFAEVWPWRTALYRLLSREGVLLYFGADFPLRPPESHVRLFAQVVAAAEAAFRAHYPKGRFVTVFWPDPPGEKVPAERLSKALDAAGVWNSQCVIDDSTPAQERWIPHDGHPLPATHDAMAAAIVAALKEAS